MVVLNVSKDSKCFICNPTLAFLAQMCYFIRQIFETIVNSFNSECCEKVRKPTLYFVFFAYIGNYMGEKMRWDDLPNCSTFLRKFIKNCSVVLKLVCSMYIYEFGYFLQFAKINTLSYKSSIGWILPESSLSLVDLYFLKFEKK